MGDLTKNISRHEIACKCGCGYDTIDFETIKIVQETCDHFTNVSGSERVILDITSGARCAEHNNRVGGAAGSQHPQNRAIDFRIRGVNPFKVYDYLNERFPNKYGLGRYKTFTHVDSRTTGMGRW